MNPKNKINIISLTSSLLAGLILFSGCIEKEKFEKPIVTDSIDEFPLDANGESYFLNRQYGDNCYANADCIQRDSNIELSNEFSFMRGQLVFKGPNLFQNSNNLWQINEHIKIIGSERTLNTLATTAESAVHQYINEPSSYSFFNPSGFEATGTLEPKILFQSRLGLPPHSFGDSGFCNLMEAENFISKSSSPMLPSLNVYASEPQGHGFNPTTNSYIAETIVICGGFNILNSHITLEAKNIIFYNSHINVSADRETPTGLKIVTQNLGYFGKNIIESNIINSNTDQKGSSVPTIEISVSEQIDFVQSDSSPNNRFNEHSFNIFMGEMPTTLEVTDSEETLN